MVGYYLVGEAPSPGTVRRPARWLVPDSSGERTTANRLLRLTGWGIDEFLSVFVARTCLWTIPHRCWESDGLRSAARVQREAVDLAGIVLIGPRVAGCFGLGEWPRFTWHRHRIAVLPYPLERCWDHEKGRAFFSSLLVHA